MEPLPLPLELPLHMPLPLHPSLSAEVLVHVPLPVPLPVEAALPENVCSIPEIFCEDRELVEVLRLSWQVGGLAPRQCLNPSHLPLPPPRQMGAPHP